MKQIFAQIKKERERQEKIHGPDNSTGWSAVTWVDGILGEEFAEAKREAFLYQETGDTKYLDRLFHELIQVAAVAVAIIQDLRGGREKPAVPVPPPPAGRK